MDNSPRDRSTSSNNNFSKNPGAYYTQGESRGQQSNPAKKQFRSKHERKAPIDSYYKNIYQKALGGSKPNAKMLYKNTSQKTGNYFFF